MAAMMTAGTAPRFTERWGRALSKVIAREKIGMNNVSTHPSPPLAMLMMVVTIENAIQSTISATISTMSEIAASCRKPPDQPRPMVLPEFGSQCRPVATGPTS